MKIIIAGSRTFSNYSLFKKKIDQVLQNIKHPEIISGCASGADSLAIKYAVKHEIPCHKMPADWKNYGLAAGYIRNTEMADIANMLIAFWNGKSKGTRHMIKIAKEKKLETIIFNTEK